MQESALLVGSPHGTYPVVMSCLCDFQFSVAEVDGACEALALLGQQDQALVVCNLPLPDLAASALVSRVRRTSPATSVILIAGPPDGPDLADVVQVGADEYVARPTDRGKFMVAMARAMNRRRTVLQADRNALLEAVEGGGKAVLGAVEALCRCLEAKDFSNDGHSRHVASIIGQLAAHSRMSEEKVMEVRLAGVLHDIGKVAVDQLILEKPGLLTPLEWREVCSHPGLGADILGSIEQLSDVALWVRHHHERHDGRGYPDGLSGDEIPFPSRIIAIADAYDAMVRPRPYRPVSGLEYAAREFRRYAGTQWDPALVRSLFECVPELELAAVV